MAITRTILTQVTCFHFDRRKETGIENEQETEMSEKLLVNKWKEQITMPFWPALCGLSHFIVSKDPLLLSVTHNF
ncbi:MAG: hypothetical protein CME32_28200 [Gimesia sp.]|nr:hypothetical protein [Gimesia sp.]